MRVNGCFHTQASYMKMDKNKLRNQEYLKDKDRAPNSELVNKFISKHYASYKKNLQFVLFFLTFTWSSTFTNLNETIQTEYNNIK